MASSSTYHTIGLDNPRIVAADFEDMQQQFGDCLPKDATNDLPVMGGLNLQQNDLTVLAKIWNSLKPDMRSEFNEKYGHIGYLIGIEPDEEMMRAMIQFWDPCYRCFTFHDVDMTPTIEEYTALFCLKLKTPDKVYLPQPGFKSKLARIMGLHTNQINPAIHKKGKDESEYVRGNFLIDFIQRHQTDKRSLQVMALAIYGLVIFPRTHGYVSVEVIDFLEQVEHGVNPIPVILAETIRSLNSCRRKGGGRFKGCIQLLHVWMKCHFQSQESYFKPPHLSDRIPLQEFKSAVWPWKRSKGEWISAFQKLTSSDVVWRAPWMPHRPILYMCGTYPWVPLLGLWGGTSYAPAMFRRQFGSEQFVPATHDLSKIEFAYKDHGTVKCKEEILKAWKSTRRMGAGGYCDSVTFGYVVWHALRGKGFTEPKVYGPDLPLRMADDPHDIKAELEARYEFASRGLRSDYAALVEENKKMMEERDKANTEAKMANTKVKRMMSRNKETKKENSRLFDTVKELKGKVLEFEKMENQSILAKERDQAVSQSISFQLDRDSLIAERDEAMSLSRRSQSLVDDLIAQNNLITQENHDLQAIVRETNKEVRTQQRKMQGMSSRIDGLKIQCKDLESINESYESLKQQTHDLVSELRDASMKAAEMAENVDSFRARIVPGNEERKELISFFDHLYRQLNYVGKFH